MSNDIQQGSAWSTEARAAYLEGIRFGQHSTIHEHIAPPLTLTITGTEDEIRDYLDGGRHRAMGVDLREAVRLRIKHGHRFNTPDEVLEWVADELAEVE